MGFTDFGVETLIGVVGINKAGPTRLDRVTEVG